MGENLRFDGRVAVVTGAGGGLGRSYALFLASRGAKVVVNDLGGSATGEGTSRAADKVVAEIKNLGGEAVANYDSVENGENIVKTALDAFGRIDIVINNAGILRDASFSKMKDSDWDIIYKVHLYGSYSVTKAAWPHLVKNKYGRIIMTASAAGLYGNFGQANYAAMKLGLLGFANTLAIEGKRYNIFTNTIAPVAGTRLTATVMPPELVEALKPDYVTPLVALLCNEKSEENGGIFELGAGWVSKLRWERTKGKFFDYKKPLLPEQIRDSWGEITDFSNPSYPTSPQDSINIIVAQVNSSAASSSSSSPSSPAEKKSGNENVDPARALAHKFTPSKVSYSQKDAAFYALSVGAARNPDPSELRFVYENDPSFCVLPTIGVIFPFEALSQLSSVEGLNFNPMMLLHGEQYLEIRKRPIAPSGTLVNQARISNIYDKGRGAVVIIDSESKDEKGDVVFFNQFSVFIRGIGNFGGERGPSTEKMNLPPERAPDAIERDPTLPNQALWYRLSSGDYNPLHADPGMAAMGGFDKPILHGLCTFGHAGRAVLKHFCGNDVTKFKNIRVRFSKHVFPGETIVTEMWKVSPTKIIFRCKVAERDEIVLSNAAVEIEADAPSASSPSPSPAAVEGGFKAAKIFSDLEKQIQAAGPELVKKINGVYQFDVNNGPGGSAQSWTVDLQTGSGSVRVGKADKAGVVLTLSDDDLVEMFSGKLNSQQAFMNGRLKIKGNMGLAMKLGQIMKQPAKL